MKIAVVVLSLLSLAAFASKPNKQSKDRPIDLDQLVELCSRLENNPQLKKFSSQISCQGYKTDWVETNSDQTVNLDNEFVVTSNISMKGNRYKVKEETVAFKLPNSQMNCTVMKEVRYELRPLTITLNSCEDLEKIQEEGRSNYCSRILQGAPVKNLKGEDTGRVRSSCD